MGRVAQHRQTRIERLLLNAGWRLARITRRGHYLYETPAGLQTVNLHTASARDDFLRRYARRDIRRQRNVPGGCQESAPGPGSNPPRPEAMNGNGLHPVTYPVTRTVPIA